MPIVAQKYEVKLLKKRKVAKNTHSFYFERPRLMDFIPGQFMRLTVDIKIPDGKANFRLFSIASSPTEKEYLMITVRTNRSAFKETLLLAEIGTKVQISAPYGMFVLDMNETLPHIFLAGGIGITPFRSMIRYAADLGLRIPITLFTSFSLVEDIVFQEEMRKISAKFAWFKLVETITQPENSKLSWTGNIGRIDSELIKTNAPDLYKSLFYLAGPPVMVDSLESVIKSLGIPENQINKEKFTGY